MSDKTEIALTVLPKIEERIVALSDALQKIAVEKAPDAWAAAKSIVMIDAIDSVVCGLVGVVMAHVGLRVAHRWLRTLKEIEREMGERYMRNEEIKYGVGGIFASVCSAIGVLMALLTLLNVWTYAAFFAPELVIARRILKGLI